MQSQETSGEHIIEVLRQRMEERQRPLTYAEFGEIALYHPKFGYYRRTRKRVGRSPETDFYTASSMGEVFRELIIDACATLVTTASIGEFTFVEIGAEPGRGLIEPGQSDHPFRAVKTLHLGDPLEIPDRSIVFSNELFDAQPFHRLVSRDGQWEETGVEVNAENTLRETILPELSGPVRETSLPPAPPDGYLLDLPLAANQLLEHLVAPPWTGLFLAFDYGKSWRELTETTPQGTARAYRRHRQSNDLLAHTGDQDLTCHICWDWMICGLERAGFHETSLQSQESFFIHHARNAIERIVMKTPGQFDPARQRLQQLLHPANMGQKFQVLHARR